MSAPSEKAIILVSGGNAGIGLAVVTRLAKEHPNSQVLMGTRSVSAGEAAAAPLIAEGLPVSVVQLDLTSDDSIDAAVKHIETTYGRLDVLVNNAAVLLEMKQDQWKLSTRELFSKTFETNVVGTVCLTEACLPLLRKSSLPKIIFVSSRMGSFHNMTDSNFPYYDQDSQSYSSSKAALNMVMTGYAKALRDFGGQVNAICPGLVKTNINNYMDGGQTTEVGAQRIVELALAGKDGPNMTFSATEGPLAW